MAFSTSTYQAVPTEVDIDLEADGFKPAEQEVQQPLTQRTIQPPGHSPVQSEPKQFEPKKAFFRILTAIAIMYGVFYGLTRLGVARSGRGCIGGTHRNVSYILPSGDKIPGIALGEIQPQASGLFTSTDKGLVKVFGALSLVELERPSRSGWFPHIIVAGRFTHVERTDGSPGWVWTYRRRVDLRRELHIKMIFAFAYRCGRTKLKSVSR